MQLPNKLYSYQKSTLALLPIILKSINHGTSNVRDLFKAASNSLDAPSDFLSAMDCLYALNAIEILDDGEVNICL